MSDEQRSDQAGSASDGKEFSRSGRPELKTRRARLLRKIREEQSKQAGISASQQTDGATTGDDYYADVLARFGIEI